uniref:Uncharacterized protein n=1 Tax=Serinus canaria TaxID=9135 RepID=A0A8C9UGX7_SERCA
MLVLFVCFSANEGVASSSPPKPRGTSQVHGAASLPPVRVCKVGTTSLSKIHLIKDKDAIDDYLAKNIKGVSTQEAAAPQPQWISTPCQGHKCSV